MIAVNSGRFLRCSSCHDWFGPSTLAGFFIVRTEEGDLKASFACPDVRCGKWTMMPVDDFYSILEFWGMKNEGSK